MGQAVPITRHDHSAAELRKLASESDDADIVRRLLAIAMVLDGFSRTEAVRHNGMDRLTLRDWVHRYNAEVVEIAHEPRSAADADQGADAGIQNHRGQRA